MDCLGTSVCMLILPQPLPVLFFSSPIVLVVLVLRGLDVRARLSPFCRNLCLCSHCSRGKKWRQVRLLCWLQHLLRGWRHFLVLVCVVVRLHHSFANSASRNADTRTSWRPLRPSTRSSPRRCRHASTTAQDSSARRCSSEGDRLMACCPPHPPARLFLLVTAS